MRWLFLVMLVLNLSYIAWETLNASKKDVSMNVPPLPDVPTILLASEVVGSEMAAPLAKSQLADADKDIANHEQVAAVASAEKTEMKTENVQGTEWSLNQLDEQGQTTLAVNVEQADELESQLAEQAQLKIPDACFTLGPFREIDTLRALTRDIKEYVEEAGFRSRDEKELSLFWVYLPPLKDRVQAKKVGNQLKAKNIKDFYIIRGEEKKNGISLGQFRNKDGAYRLAKKVKKSGFNVEVEPILKTYTLYWLDYRLADGRSIPESVTEQYLTDKISRLSRSCETIPDKAF